MGLVVRDNGGADIEPIPQGTHIAVCNMVCDLGMQTSARWGKTQHKVYIRFEVPDHRIQWRDDKGEHDLPAQIGKFYTASLGNKASLRKDLENWRGRRFTEQELAGFDLFTVINAACQLVIIHTVGADRKTYVDISGVMALPRGTPRPVAERQLIKYSIDEPDQFHLLPTWLQQKVNVPQEEEPPLPPVGAYNESRPTGFDDLEDDDIPF